MCCIWGHAQVLDSLGTLVPSQVVAVPESEAGAYLLTFLTDLNAAGFSTYYIRVAYVHVHRRWLT
jgi:hypothetical protein